MEFWKVISVWTLLTHLLAMVSLTESLAGWLTVLLTGWLTDGLTDRLTLDRLRLRHGMMKWLTHWLTDRLTGCLIVWLTSLLKGWCEKDGQTNWLPGLLYDWLVERQACRMMDWLMDCLIDGMIASLTDWWSIRTQLCQIWQADWTTYMYRQQNDRWIKQTTHWQTYGKLNFNFEIYGELLIIVYCG